MEIAKDLVQLALYDIVLFIDDSGSMSFEENGERIQDLGLIMSRVTSIATVFDDDGISIRFMNGNYDRNLCDNIKSEQQVGSLMSQVQYKGLTPIGTELKRKVIDGIVTPLLRSNQFNKPHLIIVVTDGQPAGEPTNTIFETIKYGVAEVQRAKGGGLAFQIAQVGNDLKARDFLAKLDEDPTVGRMVDCTSSKQTLTRVQS
jgi:hypothetical protein